MKKMVKRSEKWRREVKRKEREKEMRELKKEKS